MPDLHAAVQAEIDAYRPADVPGFDALVRRRRARRRRLAMVAVAAAAIGVLAAVRLPEALRDSAVTHEVVPDESAELTCGVGPSFPSSALGAPANAERGDNPAAAALRDFLAQREPTGELADLPETGWRELARTDGQALYADAGLKHTLYFADVGGIWRYAGSVSPCQPEEVPPPPLGPASWYPQAPVGAEDRAFTALVHELTCSGGRTAEGRVVPPRIEYTDTTVVITFSVRRTKAGTCQLGAPTPYQVVLREPLGDRTLLDGSRNPPVKPVSPRDR